MSNANILILWQIHQVYNTEKASLTKSVWEAKGLKPEYQPQEGGRGGKVLNS